MKDFLIDLFRMKPRNNAELHDNIKEITIRDFWNVQEGDVTSLIKKGNVLDFTEKQLEKGYFNIMDNYYEFFNREDETISRMRKEYEYAMILADYIKTQDSITRMELELLEVEIDEDKKMEKDKYTPRKKEDLSEFITYLEYMYSFSIEEDITAYKFYSYLKNLKNINKNGE